MRLTWLVASLALVNIDVSAAAANSTSPELAEWLKANKSYWLTRANRCEQAVVNRNTVPLTPFPSKQITPKQVDLANHKKVLFVEPTGQLKCDDDDSVLFAGLLCFSGESIGCDTVRESQNEKTGQWWRSPRQKREETPDGPPTPRNLGEFVRRNHGFDWEELKGDGKNRPHTSFSTDAALGVYLYLIAQGTTDEHNDARTRFAKWVGWINDRGSCKTFCGYGGSGAPKFCAHDNCYFGYSDCTIMLFLGDRLNVPIPFCRLAGTGLTFAQQVEMMVAPIETLKDEALKRVKALEPLDPLGTTTKAREYAEGRYNELLVAARKNAKNADDVMATAMSPLNKLHLMQFTHELTTANSSAAHSVHNNIMISLMLESIGESNKFLHDQIVREARRNPRNPFFLYAAYRDGQNNVALKKLQEACPTRGNDVKHVQTEWVWEREKGHSTWRARPSRDTMYWDCIFVANLVNNNIRAFEATPAESDQLLVNVNRASQFMLTTMSLLQRLGPVIESLAILANVSPENVLPTLQATNKELKKIDANKVFKDVQKVLKKIEIPPPLPPGPCPFLWPMKCGK